MSATCNGMPIISLEVSLPSSGAWVALVCVDGPSLPDAVTIVCGEITLSGTAVTRGTFAGRTIARVVGAAGLIKPVVAKHYRQMPAVHVLGEILSEVGEKLDPTSEVSTVLPMWLRVQSAASAQVSAVARQLGLSWRVNEAGEVWVGTPTWKAAPIRSATLIDWDRGAGRMVLGCVDPYLVPGMTYEGVQPRNIIHRLDGRSVRTELYA